MQRIKQVNNITIIQNKDGMFYMELPLREGKTLKGPISTLHEAEIICKNADTSKFLKNVKTKEFTRCICKDAEAISKDLKGAFKDFIRVEQRGNSIQVLTKHGLVTMKELIETLSKYYNVPIKNYHVESTLQIDDYYVWIEIK